MYAIWSAWSGSFFVSFQLLADKRTHNIRDICALPQHKNTCDLWDMVGLVVTWMQFIHTIARAEAVIFAAASLGLSIAKCYYSTCEPCNKSLGLIEIAVGVRSDVWALSAQITLHIGIYYTQKRKKKKILLHSFCNNSQRLVSIDDLAHSMAGRNSAISICIVPTAIIVIRHKSISLWRS